MISTTYITIEMSPVDLVFQALIAWGIKEPVVNMPAAKPIIVIMSIGCAILYWVMSVGKGYFKH